MSIPRFSLRDKVSFDYYSYIFIYKTERLVLQCINGVSSNTVEGEQKRIWQLKNLILTLFGQIFRHMHICL